MTTRLAILLLIFFPSGGTAQNTPAVSPKREVRAVWVTTAAGLDWPHTLDKAEQQASLHEIVRTLKAANFNTIFFQVRARGDAYYHSTYEPWAENLTGTLGKDPGWDPLAVLLAEAHSLGMEVHAWFNLYKIRAGSPAALSVPLHPSRAFPQWMVTQNGESWLDPGVPEVRAYLVNVALNLVGNYDVDGINFDYIRYPGREFPDYETYRRYGKGIPRDDWRRANINAFVTEFYDRAIAMKPMLKVGSSPLGVYNGEPDISSGGSYSSNYQDARSWLKEGKQDYVSPQMYWTLGSAPRDPDFARLVRSWQRESHGRHIYAGIGAYKPEIARELVSQIDSARATGAVGQAFFRYEHVCSPGLLYDRYKKPAIIPPMSWKDSIPPLPPANLAVSETATNVFHLEWIPPALADDGDRARYYGIYRSTSPIISTADPHSFIATTTDSRTYFVDTVRVPSGLTYYYSVTAFDKGNNESVPSTRSSGIVKELLAIKQKVSDVTSLSTSLSGTAGKPGAVAYRLAHRMPVALEVYRHTAESTDSLLATIVRDIQDGGTYIAGLDAVTFTAGRYTLRLTAGQSVLEQQLDVSP